MNERDRLIEKLIKERGGTKEQYLQLLNSIAYHESAGTLDPTIKQRGGGPGRGKYQFETGENAGGITAAKRTKNYYTEAGMEVPKWLDSITQQKNLDASTLSGEQQDVLFLGNMRKHPKADFKNLWENKQTVPEFWANYHWAGSKKDRPKRLRKFQEDYKDYNTKQREVAQTKEEPITRPPEMEKDGVVVAQPRRAESIDQIMKAYGGSVDIKSHIRDRDLNSFNAGGSHEQNPNGGVPQGMGANGKMNTVEQGESSYNFKDGKFIFTDRINTDGSRTKSGNTSMDIFADGGMVDPINPPKKKNTEVVAESKDFVKNWFSSPTTKARYAMNMKKGFSDTLPDIEKGLKQVEDTTINYDAPTSNKAAGAQYKNGNIDFYKDPTDESSTHEYTHAMGIDDNLSKIIRSDYGTPAKAIQEKTGLPFQEAVAQEHNISTDSAFGRQKLQNTVEHSRYMSKQGELYPRIMEMRKVLNVQPGQEIDDNMIQEIKSKTDNPLFKYYSDDQIKSMLNTLASNTTGGDNVNMAAEGGKLDQGCGGPGQPPCKQKVSKEDEVKNVKSFFNDYINSEEYKHKLIKRGQDEPEKLQKQRLDNINNTDVIFQDKKPGFFKELKMMLTDEPYSAVGSVARPYDKNVILDMEQIANESIKSNKELALGEITAHELGHSAITNVEGNKYKTNLSKQDSQELYDRLKYKKGSKHETNPEERYSDLQGLRYHMQKEGLFDSTKTGGKFTKENLEKVYDHAPGSNILSRLGTMYSDEDLIWLLNNIADNSKKNNKNKNLT